MKKLAITSNMSYREVLEQLDKLRQQEKLAIKKPMRTPYWSDDKGKGVNSFCYKIEGQVSPLVFQKHQFSHWLNFRHEDLDRIHRFILDTLNPVT